jgi:hypothetical protein
MTKNHGNIKKINGNNFGNTHTHTPITQKFENDFRLGTISSRVKWTFEKKRFIFC